jgi:hypothetical protein
MNNLHMFKTASVTALIAVVIVLCSFAVAFAADLGDDLGGGFDGFGNDTFSEGGSFGYGYEYSEGGSFPYDYGYSEGGSYPYDYGYSEGGSFPYEYGYDEGGSFPYEYGYDEGGSFPYEYDYECGCYDYDGDYGYDDYDYYEETYYDEGCDCYSYSSPSYSSGSKGFSFPSFSSSGYSQVKPMSFGSPSYPVYTPPAKTTGGNTSSSVSNISNTTITNVDNSINDSFNNYNSGNTIIAAVTPATPQYPVVYTQPAPYCQIYQASAASGYGVNAVYLSWSSSNASSAYLSNVGSVSVNGSKTVWPTYGMTYTLTVYGANGQSAQCSTAVQAYSAPYVSLTQIPYTGFDFGTLGNAMYWAGLAIFALGAGYLAVYYIPAVAFAGARSRKFAPVVAAKAPILVEKEAAEVKVAPIVNSIRKAGTLDSMAIVVSKDGSMPKIVISRE